MLGDDGSWTNLLQEDMFSEYDKTGIKYKILYKVYHQINFNFLIMTNSELHTVNMREFGQLKKNSIQVHMKIEFYKY